MAERHLNMPNFYLNFNLIILSLVVLGFGLNAMTNPSTLPPTHKIIWIHGLIMFGWYVLIVIQSGLIRKKQTSLHRKIGYSSIPLAIGILISGIVMSKVHYNRPDAFLFSTINTFILINFTILYSLGIVYRTKPDFHKRFMLLASLSAVFPGLGRIILGLQFNQYLSVPLWIMLVLVLGTVDWMTKKKIHPATWIGSSLIFIGIGLTLYLLENAAWKELMDQLMANR